MRIQICLLALMLGVMGFIVGQGQDKISIQGDWLGIGPIDHIGPYPYYAPPHFYDEGVQRFMDYPIPYYPGYYFPYYYNPYYRYYYYPFDSYPLGTFGMTAGGNYPVKLGSMVQYV